MAGCVCNLRGWRHVSACRSWADKRAAAAPAVQAVPASLPVGASAGRRLPSLSSVALTRLCGLFFFLFCFFFVLLDLFTSVV